MSRKSFSLYIDLNGEPVDMSVSEFLTHLSTIDDDSEKVNEAIDFILNLKEELFIIASSEYQFPNCMRFLKDAIATVQNEKWKCERRVRKKEANLHESNSDIARGTPTINNITNKNTNDGQIDNVSNESFLENEAPSDMTLDLIRSESSVQDDVLVLSDPMVQPEDFRSDPNVVLEVTRRQRMVWSADLHRRFRFAVEALGGPREAKPKQIHDLLKVDNLTTEQIKSHLQRYRKHLNSRGQRSVVGSSPNMQNGNAMLVRTRFSLLCMQPGESSNNNMTRAPTND